MKHIFYILCLPMLGLMSQNLEQDMSLDALITNGYRQQKMSTLAYRQKVTTFKNRILMDRSLEFAQLRSFHSTLNKANKRYFEQALTDLYWAGQSKTVHRRRRTSFAAPSAKPRFSNGFYRHAQCKF
jgi:hypothetical protein